jgi:hypothetical protein
MLRQLLGPDPNIQSQSDGHDPWASAITFNAGRALRISFRVWGCRYLGAKNSTRSTD